MKNSLFVVLLVSGLNLYGQNDSIEKTTLYSRKLSNEISQDEFLNSWHKWNETIKEINGYPNMPLDQNGQVHYSFINNFPGENKDRLFNITLEWLSINYGLIPSSIYCNKEDGKIILRNNMEMKIGYTCNYTSVITIKNEKMLMEFYNISFQQYFSAHYTGDMFVPERTLTTTMRQIFPVILKKPSEWKSYLLLIAETNKLFKDENQNLIDYITASRHPYDF